MANVRLDDPALDQEVTLRLRQRDVLLMRSGLEELLRTYTRHEHLFDEIRGALSRLPRPEDLDATAAAGTTDEARGRGAPTPGT